MQRLYRAGKADKYGQKSHSNFKLTYHDAVRLKIQTQVIFRRKNTTHSLWRHYQWKLKQTAKGSTYLPSKWALIKSKTKRCNETEVEQFHKEAKATHTKEEGGNIILVQTIAKIGKRNVANLVGEKKKLSQISIYHRPHSWNCRTTTDIYLPGRSCMQQICYIHEL